MKQLKLIVIVSVMLIVAACGSPANPPSDQAVAATVNAAVQSTTQAQQNNAATIDAAVKATNAAQPLAITAKSV
jgi:hypothetical protein